MYEHYKNVTLMTEIQLKNIVERLKSDEKETKSDDETMVKNGVIISKFSFEALGFSDVDDRIKSKIHSRIVIIPG